MSQVVTELVIDSDTSGADRFSQSMDKASGSAQQGISSAAGMSLAIAGVGVAFVGALVGLRSFFDYVGQQNKQLVDIEENARSAGMTVRDFQETLFAARTKGLTEKDFVSGLDKITTDLTAASSGVTEFGRLFEANGLKIKNANGELKTAKQALGDIMGLVQDASPEVARGVTKIVGVSKEWIPFLRQATEELDRQKKAASDLGLVINDDVIARAKEFDAQWKTAIATWDLQFKASLAGIMPLLVKMATLASTIIEGVGSVNSSVSRWMTPDEDKSKAQLNDQINQVAQLRDMMESLAKTGGEFKKFQVTNLAELVGLGGDATIKDVDALLTKLSALYDKKPTAITVGAVGSTVLPPNENKDALDREIDRLQKHIAVTKADTEAVGQSEAARAGLRAEATLYAAAERAGFTDLEKFADKFMKIREEVEKTTAALKQKQATDQADFALETVFLSDTERQIATIQKQLHGPDWKNWMNDGLSSTIRLTDNLKLVSDSLKDVGKAAFSAALQGKLGMDGLVSTLDAVAKKLSDKAFDNLLSGNPDQMIVGAFQAGASALISAFTGDQKAKKALEDAKAQWAKMSEQVVNFNLAAKGFTLGPLTNELQSLHSTTKQLQDAAFKAKDSAGEKSAANAFNSAVERIWAEFKNGTQTLTPLQQQIKSVNDEAAGLKDTLTEFGFAGRATAIDGIVQQQIDALTKQFNQTFISGLTARLNTASGKTFLNDAANLLVQHQQDLASAGDLGNDPTLLGQVAATFKAEAQKIVDGAELVGTAFTDFTTQFPTLQGVVHEFTQSAVEDSKALRDAQNSAAKSITDYLNNLTAGPGSTQSPLATLASAQTLYQANLGLAQGGNVDAQNKFVSLADNLEKAARVVYASGQGYQDIRNSIINQGLALPAVQATTDPVTQAVRDAITAIQIGNAALNTINTTAGGTTGAVNNVAGIQSGTLLPAINAGNATAVATALQTYFNQIDPSGRLASIVGTTQSISAYSVNTAGSTATTAAKAGDTALNTLNTRGSVDAGTGVLNLIKSIQQSATDQLALLNAALNPSVNPVSITYTSAGAGTSNPSLGHQAANEQALVLLEQIKINTWATAGNTRGLSGGAARDGALASGGWITGGIPGRDSVQLASRANIGMPGEFVLRYDIAQANKSWLPDFNATGRLPFNDNLRTPIFSAPNVTTFRGGGDNNAALLAEVRALRAEVEQLRRENNSGNAAIANTTSSGLKEHAEKLGGKIEASGKRGAFAVSQAAKERAAS